MVYKPTNTGGDWNIFSDPAVEKYGISMGKCEETGRRTMDKWWKTGWCFGTWLGYDFPY